MQIDYLVGRAVTYVAKRNGGGWEIGLEGDAKIVYEDSDAELPEEVEGLFLSLVTLGLEKTTLWFGSADKRGVAYPDRCVLELAPMLIGVSDPDYSKGELEFPQRGPVEARVSPQDEQEGSDEG